MPRPSPKPATTWISCRFRASVRLSLTAVCGRVDPSRDGQEARGRLLRGLLWASGACVGEGAPPGTLRNLEPRNPEPERNLAPNLYQRRCEAFGFVGRRVSTRRSPPENCPIAEGAGRWWQSTRAPGARRSWPTRHARFTAKADACGLYPTSRTAGIPASPSASRTARTMARCIARAPQTPTISVATSIPPADAAKTTSPSTVVWTG